MPLHWSAPNLPIRLATGAADEVNVSDRAGVGSGGSSPGGEQERPHDQYDRDTPRRYDDEQNRQGDSVEGLPPWRITIVIEPAATNHHSLCLRRPRRPAHHFAGQRIASTALARALTGGACQGLHSVRTDVQSDPTRDRTSPRDVVSFRVPYLREIGADAEGRASTTLTLRAMARARERRLASRLRTQRAAAALRNPDHSETSGSGMADEKTPSGSKRRLSTRSRAALSP